MILIRRYCVILKARFPTHPMRTFCLFLRFSRVQLVEGLRPIIRPYVEDREQSFEAVFDSLEEMLAM